MRFWSTGSTHGLGLRHRLGPSGWVCWQGVVRNAAVHLQPYHSQCWVCSFGAGRGASCELSTGRRRNGGDEWLVDGAGRSPISTGQHLHRRLGGWGRRVLWAIFACWVALRLLGVLGWLLSLSFLLSLCSLTNPALIAPPVTTTCSKYGGLYEWRDKEEEKNMGVGWEGV